MELNILRANPAGNITVFVLDPVEKALRAAIAEKIMAIGAHAANKLDTSRRTTCASTGTLCKLFHGE